MLKDTFFSITETADRENGCTCRLALNANHPIFQAHFAGNPIMPGACIVQLIKELASVFYNRDMFVCSVKNMKFLHVINPLETPEIAANLSFTIQDNGQIAVSTVLYLDDKIFSKSTMGLRV